MNAFVAFASSGLRTGQLQPPEPASAGDCFRDYFHYSGCGTPCQQSKRVGGEGAVSIFPCLLVTQKQISGVALRIAHDLRQSVRGELCRGGWFGGTSILLLLCFLFYPRYPISIVMRHNRFSKLYIACRVGGRWGNGRICAVFSAEIAPVCVISGNRSSRIYSLTVQ